MIDPLGKETLYTYDDNGRLETTTAPDGGVTRYTYDGAGRLRDDDGPGRPGHDVYGYDLAGRLTSVENPAGGVTEYEYDDAGRQRLIRDPLGHETEKTYDDDGNLATVLDPLDHLTRYDYDLADRLFKVTDAAHGVTLTGYDRDGRVDRDHEPRAGDDDGGATTRPAASHRRRTASATRQRYGYDDAGRLLTTTDPLDHAETRTYDPAGRLQTVTTASGIATTYTYDPRGMVATDPNALGHTTTYTYDDAGSARDRARSTRLHDDLRLRPGRPADDDQGPEERRRHARLQPRRRADVDHGRPQQGLASDVRPARRRQDDDRSRSSRGTVLEYNDAGQLEQKTDARGVVRSATTTTMPGNLEQASAGPIEIDYTYDALNRRKTMDGGVGVTTWSYDARKPARRRLQAPAGTVGYTYDDAGRRADDDPAIRRRHLRLLRRRAPRVRQRANDRLVRLHVLRRRPTADDDAAERRHDH